jgi:two-component system response regulator MprA
MNEESTEELLIIEDDPLIVNVLQLGLSQEGFEVIYAKSGRAGLELFRKEKPALVILDLMLPDLDGMEICERIRSEDKTVPILILTARDQIESKVSLLKSGADDYLVKPFDFGELSARVQALLRRSGLSQGSKSLAFLNIKMFTDSREVFRGKEQIDLSAKEFDLLHMFLNNPRHVLSKETIIKHVWGFDFLGDCNIVEVYVGHLRKKLGEPTPIQTIRGVGYCLKQPK